MSNTKGLRLHEKTPTQRFKIKLAANAVFYGYLNFLDLLMKKHTINYSCEKKGVIYATWHGTQIGMGLFPKEHRKNINILISPSNDGEIIAQVCHLLGFSLIRGSFQREGEKAMREMIKALKAGENIAFFPDGPIGPAKKVKKGLIKLAKMSGCPIIPIMTHYTNTVSLNSWDNYNIPVGLSHGTLIMGEKIYVEENCSIEEEKNYRHLVEAKISELEKTVFDEHKTKWGK
ncbi:MAG: lysophospholipid acyltransferase family protein [Candidatus Gastranaerophilales bacterium]|nr:lysophospholipid acyltransferase family protein [Candidatus Gastranaerophilales bacterium]